MTGYDEMSAADLRLEREEWHGKVCQYAREYRALSDFGDPGLVLGAAVVLDQALARVAHIDRLLRLGVAA